VLFGELKTNGRNKNKKTVKAKKNVFPSFLPSFLACFLDIVMGFQRELNMGGRMWRRGRGGGGGGG
jgi:hypothetical protein